MGRCWRELAWPAFGGLGPGSVAILPVAAVEQHGPHLPLGVDAILNAGLLERAMARAADDVLALPMQWVGSSGEHVAFPGTLSLSPETLVRVLVEVGESVLRAGVRRLVVLNSHGGNSPVIDLVVQRLRGLGMLAVHASWMRLGVPEGVFDAEELAFGIHGGAVETSLMLHLRPELVDMAQARAFPSGARAGDVLVAHGRIGFGWLAQDLNPAGVVGDAGAATAEKGRLVAEYQVGRFVALLGEVAAFDLGRLQSG